VYVGSVETSEPGEFRRAHIHVNGVPITLVIDLGAKVSIISKSFYDRHLTHIKLRPAIVKLRAYQGQRIDCLGCVILTVEVKGKPPLRFRFHVTSRGEWLLGLDLFDALGGAVHLGDTTYVNGASSLPATAAAAADSQAVAANVTDAAAAADAVADISESIAAHTDMTSSSVSLDEYPVLLKDGGTLGSFVHKPKIDPTVRPVQQKFWHPPLAMREPIANELKRLEKAGIIERIESSPWIPNLVTSRKKDNSVRICVNLTNANETLIPERYPLPTLDELTEKVAGCTVFSKIDLLWGYLQLKLAPEVRYLTAFVSHLGVFQYTSLPFGISTGPSAFHHVIRQILSDLPGCASLLDDILIYGKDMADHDQKLRAVLGKLLEYNATVRRDKCVIGQPEVEFNGHIISAAGIRPLKSNVEAILRIPTPKDQRELLRFVCSASYYLRFVKDYAALSWSAECETSFREIKRRLASPPILALFDVSADTILTCDASSIAVGACLSQISNGVYFQV
jgi:hypothetical protein